MQPAVVRTVPASPVVPTTAIAVVASVMVGVATVLAAVLAAITFDEYRTVGHLVDGVGRVPSYTELAAIDGDRQRVMVWFGLAYFAAGVVFICWQFRHSRNAVALAGPRGLGPSWAVGGWFIPGAAAVLPAVEVFQSSRPSSPPGRVGRLHAVRDGLLVVVWSASLAVGLWATVRGGVDDVAFVDLSGAHDLHARLAVARVGGVLLVVAGVLAVVMVVSFTRRQRRLLDQRFVRPYGFTGW